MLLCTYKTKLFFFLQRFINMLLGHMSVEVLREEACDCLFEIVNKGMDPIDKTKLVESLCQVLQSAGLFSIDQVCVLIFNYRNEL